MTIAAAISALAGCQTMQGWLQTGEPTPEYPAPITALQASQRASANALGRARAYAQGRADAERGGYVDEFEAAFEESSDAAAKAEAEAPSQATLRTLKRRPAGNPLELVDPTVSDARVELTEELRSAFRASVKMDENAVIFTGNFARNSGDELVVLKPGKEVVVYGRDARIARLDLGGTPAPEAFAELGLQIDPSGVQAVELIEDQTLQLLTHARVPTEDGKFAYKVSVLKVIGPFIAEVFTQTLATSETENGPLIRAGAYEFLRGEEHRDIRWIPADDAGKLSTDQATLLKWNHWEGMYRVPGPPAAGPKRDTLQVSQKSDAPAPPSAQPARAALTPRQLSTHPG